jgi:hypothetical protein
MYTSSCKVLGIFVQDQPNLDFCDILKQGSNIRFHKNLSVGAKLFYSDRYYEANRCFLQMC